MCSQGHSHTSVWKCSLYGIEFWLFLIPKCLSCKRMILSEIILNDPVKKRDSCLNICWLALSPPFEKSPMPLACFHGRIFLAPWHLAVAGNKASFFKEIRDCVRKLKHRTLYTNNFQHVLVEEMAWIKWRTICKEQALPLWVYGNKDGYNGTCLRSREIRKGWVRKERKALASGKEGKEHEPCSAWDFSG